MDLEVDIFSKNLEVTERIGDYVNKKVAKLGRFLNDVEDTRVDLSFNKAARSSTDRQIAQITIRGKGYILRTEERSDDIFTAIDTAVEKMQRQIERLKGKRQRVRGDGKTAAQVVPAPVMAEEEPDQDQGYIARRKSFTLVPMDEQEAIEQMKLLGHETFFIFYNVNTNNVNVLYTRRDGTYGLIEPVIG